jgi:fibronectin type 3 domain-containing protein
MAFRKHNVLAAVLVIVAAAIFAGCADDTTAPSDQVNAAPPQAPGSIQAYVNGTGVVITWRASSEPTILGYNIYRIDGPGGGVTRLNATTIPAARYSDGTADPTHSYEYRVTSVGAGNTESAYSSVTVTMRRQLRDRMDRVPNERP